MVAVHDRTGEGPGFSSSQKTRGRRVCVGARENPRHALVVVSSSVTPAVRSLFALNIRPSTLRLAIIYMTSSTDIGTQCHLV